MADTTKTVIIDVTAPEVAKRIDTVAQLRKEIDALKNSTNELKKASGDNSKEIAANEATIRALNNELRKSQKELDNVVKAAMSADGSLDQMQAAVSILNAEFKAMGETERTTTERGKELSSQILQLNEKINATKLGVGDSTSNIGKYEQATVSLRQEIRQLTQTLAQMQLEGKGNSAEFRTMVQRLGELKDTMGDVQAQSKFFADDQRWITATTQAVQGLVGAYSAYTGVMTLVGGENEELQKSMQKLQALMTIMMGLTQVSTALNKDNMVVTAAKNLVEKYHALQLAVSNRAIAANIVLTEASTVAARVNAAAWRLASNAMKSVPILAVITALAALLTVVYKVTQQQKEYNDKLKEAATASKQYRDYKEEIVKLTQQATDGYIEEKVKLETLFTAAKQATGNKEAYKKAINDINKEYGRYLPNLLTEKSSASDIAAAYERINDALTKKLAYEVAVETAKKSAIEAGRVKDELISLDAQNAAVKQYMEYLRETGKAKSSIPKLSLDEETQQFAFAQSVIKNAGVSVAAFSSTLNGADKVYAVLASRQNTLSNELNLYNSAVQQAIDNAAQLSINLGSVTRSADGTTKSIKELDEQLKIFATDFDNIEERYRAWMDAQKDGNATNEEATEIFDEMTVAVKSYVDQSLDLISKTRISKEQMEGYISTMNSWVGAVGSMYSAINDLFTAIDNRTLQGFQRNSDAQKKELQRRLDNGTMNQEEYNRAVQRLDEDLDKKKAELARKQAIRERTLMTLQIVASMAAAIMRAYSDGGPIGGIILEAIPAAVGAIQLAALWAQPLPQAKRGRLIRGASHETGGEMLEAESGEAVINQKGTNAFLPQLDAIQRATGGVPFINDGGYAAMKASQGMMSTGITAADLAEMNIFVTVDEINRGQSRVKVIENRAAL